MTQPFPYVAINGTAGTVTFAAGTATPGDYSLERKYWSPAIAHLRPTQIGGQGRYSEVIEELEINITGSTVAAAYANLALLNRLLDEAERWTANDSNAGVVTFRYSPQGSTTSSTAAFLRAVILGRAPGDTSRAPVELPPDFNETGMTRFTLAVRLRFWRRGRWLLPDATETTGTSVTVGNTSVINPVGSLSTVSPLNVAITGFDPATMPTISGGFLAMASRDSLSTMEPLISQPMSTATAAGYTAFNDSGNRPIGGTNVLRYTPTGTAAATSGTISPFSITESAPTAVLAVVRNNSATRTFQIRANLTGRGITVSTPYAVVDTSSQQPRIIRLGIVKHPAEWGSLSITCLVDSTTGSPTLDIDYLVLLSIRDETCRLIEHSSASISGFTSPIRLRVINSELIRLPQMYVQDSSVSVNLAYLTYYDAIDAQTRDNQIYVQWHATRAQYWRFTNNAGTVLTYQAIAQRTPAYLGPI